MQPTLHRRFPALSRPLLAFACAVLLAGSPACSGEPDRSGPSAAKAPAQDHGQARQPPAPEPAPAPAEPQAQKAPKVKLSSSQLQTMPGVPQPKREFLQDQRLTSPAPAPAPGAAPEAEKEKRQPGAPAATLGTLESDAHGATSGLRLPQISPTPGVTFVETLIALLDYELKGRTLGWRPNDLVIGKFTDNVNNFQLGVLEACRFTTLRLKDSLTRMGDADSYDQDLEQALNLLMNKATVFWFPSAEGSYSEALDHLRVFLGKLKNGQRHFYYRTDTFLALLASYKDLLGNVNKNLTADRLPDGSPVSFFQVDDFFYYAKGVTHVMYDILRVVRVGFKDQLTTIDAVDIVNEGLHELKRADDMDPIIILDGSPDSIFANHRANLNAPLSHVAHLFEVMSRF